MQVLYGSILTALPIVSHPTLSTKVMVVRGYEFVKRHLASGSGLHQVHQFPLEEGELTSQRRNRGSVVGQLCQVSQG